MTPLERNQVRLILDRQKNKSCDSAQDAHKALYAKHAADGILRSGATVKQSVRIAQDLASRFVESAVNDVSDIAQDLEAYNLIRASVEEVFRHFEGLLDKAVEKVTVGDPGPNESVKTGAEKLFAERKGRVMAQLEIHRFTFTRPSPGESQEQRERIWGSLRIPGPAKNPGGKPLAQHWDAMWAAIAVQLWNGELKPQTQADVKDAMFAWFNAAEIDIGDTAVTQRARQLWQATQDTES